MRIPLFLSLLFSFSHTTGLAASLTAADVLEAARNFGFPVHMTPLLGVDSLGRRCDISSVLDEKYFQIGGLAFLGDGHETAAWLDSFATLQGVKNDILEISHEGHHDSGGRFSFTSLETVTEHRARFTRKHPWYFVPEYKIHHFVEVWFEQGRPVRGTVRAVKPEKWAHIHDPGNTLLGEIIDCMPRQAPN
jgi:hypothetical protein